MFILDLLPTYKTRELCSGRLSAYVREQQCINHQMCVFVANRINLKILHGPEHARVSRH